MTDEEYSVTYVARSPASLPQDEFAELVDGTCNEWAGQGLRLVNAVGDYGARVTLGVWLIFAREAGSASEELPIESAAEEDGAPAFSLDEDSGESPEPAGGEPEESTE